MIFLGTDYTDSTETQIFFVLFPYNSVTKRNQQVYFDTLFFYFNCYLCSR